MLERHVNMGGEANILVQPSSAVSTEKAICQMERRGKQNLERSREERARGFREREGDLGLGVNIVPVSGLFDTRSFPYPQIISDILISLQ